MSTEKPDNEWYRGHMKDNLLKDEHYMAGLCMTPNEFKVAKVNLKKAREAINPNFESYSGNGGAALKKTHTQQLLQMYPEFGRGDPEWTEAIAPLLMNRCGRKPKGAKQEQQATDNPDKPMQSTEQDAQKGGVFEMPEMRRSLSVPPPPPLASTSPIILNIATVEGGVAKIESQVATDTLDPPDSFQGLLAEMSACDNFPDEPKVAFMPERPKTGGIPIKTPGGFKTALRNVRELHMTEVLVTAADEPDMRKEKDSEASKRGRESSTEEDRPPKSLKMSTISSVSIQTNPTGDKMDINSPDPRGDGSATAGGKEDDTSDEDMDEGEDDDRPPNAAHQSVLAIVEQLAAKNGGIDGATEQAVVDAMAEAQRLEQEEEMRVANIVQAIITEEPQDATTNPETARINDDELAWAEYLFPTLTREQLQKTDQIALPGWDLNPDFKAYPYQLFSVSTGFKQESTALRGGILGDEPGAGKTIEMVLKAVFRKYHLSNVDEVVRYWAMGDAADAASHLPKNESNTDNRCPTQGQRPLACWCEPYLRDSVKENARPGPCVIVTPKCGLNGFQEDLRVVVENSSFASKHGIHIAFMPGLSKDDELYHWPPLTKQDIPLYCARPDIDPEQAYMKKNATHSYKNETFDRSWTIRAVGRPECDILFNTTERGKVRDPSALIIVTTPQAFRNQLEPLLEINIACIGSIRIPGRNFHPLEQKRPYCVLPLPYILIDECHLAVGGQYQQDIRRATRRSCTLAFGIGVYPRIWGASGTPESSLGSTLKFCIFMLKTDDWSQDEVLKVIPALTSWKETTSALSSLFRSVDYDLETLTGRAEYTKFKAIFAKCNKIVMHRRFLKNRWYDGRPLVQMACRFAYKPINVTPNAKEVKMIHEGRTIATRGVIQRYNDRLRAWAEEGSNPKSKPTLVKRKDNGFNLVVALASITHFAHNFATVQAPNQGDPEDRRFVKAHSFIQPLLQQPRGPKMKKHLLNIRQHEAAKFVWLLKFLKRIQATPRSDGSRSKVIIASWWPITTAIIKAVVEMEFPGAAVDYTSDTKDEDRIANQTAFKDNDNKWIMIATVQTMSVGLNFQRANHAVLFEPLTNAATTKQFYARIHRLGQMEKEIFGWVLCNTGSSSEVASLKKSNGVMALDAELGTEDQQEVGGEEKGDEQTEEDAMVM